MPQQARALVILLRLLGLINFAAVVAVVAPREWIIACHEMLGLGTFPSAPIASYLARSTSLWFASFGVLLWFVSFNVRHYSSLITFVALAMTVQGLFMIGIDYHERMPEWWIAAEGPTCLLLGMVMLILNRHKKASEADGDFGSS